MKEDPILGEWNIVRKNFMGSFFEMPNKEWERFLELLILKNPELKNQFKLSSDKDFIDDDDLDVFNKWTFVINKDFYPTLKKMDEITWNSNEQVKKDDVIFVYTSSPHSDISFILKAETDTFEDPVIRKNWNRPAINVRKEIEIPEPISFKELKNNPILLDWGPVKNGFRGSHFKMSEIEYEELKRLILEKNPFLEDEINELEVEMEDEDEISDIGFYDLNAGRAHIVRDICYLISENSIQSIEELSNLLREKVGDNKSYWRAYYQRSNKYNSPGYNLSSARTLGFVEKNQFLLTSLGKKLVKSLDNNELFTHHHSIDTKKFFFELALKNNSIKTAMRILRKRGRLRFYSPLCDRTNRVFWKKSQNHLCEHQDYPECKDCDRDYKKHIKESSLPYETLQKTKGKGYGFVFWMTSRITPMHLTGTEPGYSGNYIYWDKEAEKELGDLIKMLDDVDSKINPRIWKISPGEPEKSEIYWPIYTEKGYIGIGWTEFPRDYREFKSQEELKTELDKAYGKSKSQSAKMIWDFVNEIKIGDYVIANRGKKEVIGIGVITSDHIAPDDPENLNLEEYPDLRKVDWKIIDNIEVPINFDRKTVTELDGKRWNEIISSYARMNPNFKVELLNKIYKEFKDDYLDTEVGQEHLKAYQDESQKVKKTYEEVQEKRNENIDVTDEILYGLVPHKGKSIVGFISNIKAFFEKTYEIKPDKFPDIANKYFDTIHDFIENDDMEIQEDILNNFASSEYSKGFGSGTLTPILFFINPNYPLINNKTVDTVTFLSKIMGEPIKLDMELNHYVENKEKFNNFLIDLSEYLPELYDFAIFDIFCHWLCDKNLGFYAKGNPLPLLESTIKIEDFKPVFLKPDSIETKLKIDYKLKEQVCGTLNSSKHVMLTGAPGTGKTNLAEDVCKIAENKKFTNGYVLTTATSDWTTFDTIGGYMPDESGKLIFEEGKFLQAIREDKWLIIDEINRADIDKAFGQLFTVLSGQGVELPFKINGKPVKIQPTEEIGSYFDSESASYKVGKNWRILATMNIYDKDFLFEMSYAFMRRFTFIYIELPLDKVFIELINVWGNELDDEMLSKIYQLLQINPYREIGPAIFKDVIEYIAEREKIGSKDHILEDAVMSYIMPQFEGLEKPQILEIWKIFNETFKDTAELKRRLEEISTIKLDELK